MAKVMTDWFGWVNYPKFYKILIFAMPNSDGF
jgi:hypothetical protein